MRRIATYMLIVFIGMLLIQCTSEKERLNKKLNEMAENLNQSTPIKLDQYTQFDSVAVSDDNIFTYFYTVKNTKNPMALLDSMEIELGSNIKKAFKTDQSLKVFKDNNVTINYIYSDSTGSPVRTIIVTPEDYN
ncbi:MAG: hypothetical protein WCR12_05425 [Dysgonamonadaceae bacterium]